MQEKTLDLDRLKADIRAAADKYPSLRCVVTVICGGRSERLTFGGMPAEDDAKFILDGAGGLLAGLSVIKLCEQDRLSPDHPVFRHISGREIPLSPDLTVERLLRRTSGLPDPMRQRLIPDMHSYPDFSSCDCDEQLRRETAAALAGRDFVSQLRLPNGLGSPGSGFAPSSLDEALLCELIIRITGSTLEEYQLEHIFRPLGIEPVTGARTGTPGHIRGGDGQLVSFTPEENTAGLYTVTLSQLERLLAAIAGGELLSDDGQAIADGLSGPCSLPFSRKEGFLCGTSDAAGWTATFMVWPSGEGILITSDYPLPVRDEDGVFRRFDLDISGCVNSQLVFPSRTRMERLSLRNVSRAAAIEREPEQSGFTSSPAADIALSAADKSRQTLVATEGSVTVGLLSFTIAPSGELARLETVLVDRRYRRRGFGRIMVSWAIRHLRQKGVRQLALCVDRRNLPAQGLYNRLGFELQAVYESVYVLSLSL